MKHSLSFRTLLCASSAATASFACNIFVQQRRITRLYTSYYSGELMTNQLVRPIERVPTGFRTKDDSKIDQAERQNDSVEGVSWDNESETDTIRANQMSSQPVVKQRTKIQRPYVPLHEVAKVELQGDYLTEGGLHQEAVEHYGVVAKAYGVAYPDNHPQYAGILIKLAGGLRRTGRLKSSKAILEKALSTLDNADRPPLELIVEATFELGLTKEALGELDAGAVFEEGVAWVDQFHNFGESHRTTRLLPRLGRRFNINMEEKFLFFSPFDCDRTFAIADRCLARAEEFYDRLNRREDVLRVLQKRKELIDKKFFNMRDFAGKIHTLRGHWMRRAGILTNAPTPDELLRYSPTIHQVYRDFQYELNAPLDRQDEVMKGTNRVVMDMGNPYRRKSDSVKRTLRDANYNFAQYLKNEGYGEKV